MFITKKHFSRRTLLKGAGVSLALPLLDAMIPAATAISQTAAAAGARTRMGFFYIPHGAIMWNTTHGKAMDKWTPTGEGAAFQLSPIMKPLEPHKGQVISIGNLQNKAMEGGVHSRTPATWLSCLRPDDKASGAKMSTTLDQIASKRIGQGTTLPSLELASETTIQSAACGNQRCFYSSTLSFRDATSPLPMEFNPRKVFIQLFGEGDNAEERDAISKLNLSLLDRISGQTAALKRELDAGDRAALDSYLESVREIERRIEQASEKDLGGIDLPPAPIGPQDAFPEQVKLMFDLIALAFQADVTRVVSFMMVSEGTNRSYNHLGVSDSFHPVSHHANDLTRMEKLVRIQTWHMQQFADFAGKLAKIPDGEETLLDSATFLYGSNMSNSDRHNGYPLPTILVGGKLAGGKHIDMPANTPLANLHLSLLNRIGIEEKSFGDSTGTIAGV
ncbi:MAG TPA: DUF1552 domain-containing protein [Terriglobia bacterium]|nr:DUF1552 domain-containing protein [Terriglobia bacterium]